MLSLTFPTRNARRVAAAFALIAACLGTTTASARELRIGLITPPNHVWTQVANRMAGALPGATDDTLELAVFPGGQLGSEQEMYQQMGTGLLDVGLMTGAITSLRAPSIAGWFTPYLFEDVAGAIAATKTPAAREMLDQLEDAGLVGLGYTFAGMRHILMREDTIESPADLADKKIRIVPFPAAQVWWNAAGAVPTPVNLTEVYSGLQSGLLDGIDIDLDALVGLNFQEVGKVLTVTHHMAFPAVLVVSKLAWDSFSDEERAAFDEVAQEALSWGSQRQIEAEVTNLETLGDEITVNELKNGEEAFAAANKAFQDEYESDEIIDRFQQQVGEGTR